MSISVNIYAAYKSGFLGNNILDTYFSFVANILLEKKIIVVDAVEVIALFNEKYGVELPLPFIHQVLGVGVENGALVPDHGTYSISLEQLATYKFDATDFGKNWLTLVQAFQAYCVSIEVDITNVDIESVILDFLSREASIIDYEEKSEAAPISSMEYSWYSFVKETAKSDSELYKFIVAISAANSTVEALFYVSDEEQKLSGLKVYLDSPIVFALLGMDVKERTESYKKLVADMQKSGIDVHVLDNNFQEVDGIVTKAAGWANSTQYDIRKANNAARFFHDSEMEEHEITEFCGSLESKLNDLGITIIETNYDRNEHQFQEDYTQIAEMIKEKYINHGFNISSEKARSIEIDATSIIMVYRKRQGQTATHISKSKHLLLTSNNAVANVAKLYESNRSTNSGHIPACVSADLFGTILWLNSPMEMMEYKKLKLVADCYGFLKPSKGLLDKYIESLDNARKTDEIDEKQYLFLRTHPVVFDSLMNVTRGDYARFDSSTYREVFDDIVETSKKEYYDEAKAHDKTKEKLDTANEQVSVLTQKNSDLEKELKQIKAEAINRKVKHWGWIYSLLLFGIPYIIIVAITERLKSMFEQSFWGNVVWIALLSIIAIVALCFFKKGKEWCMQKVRNRLVKKK